MDYLHRCNTAIKIALVKLTCPPGKAIVLCLQQGLNTLAAALSPITGAMMIFLAVLTAHSTQADPWIQAGDERTRHHLQILADSGELNLPLTSWPLMWSGVKQGLDTIRVEELNAMELWSYRYLRHKLDREMQASVTRIKVKAASNASTVLNGFGSDSREGSEATIGFSVTTDTLAIKIQNAYALEPTHGETSRFDGSYAAFTWSNWVMGAGAIDRWWGPGWQGSMSLSHNARPSVGLFLQRKDTSTYDRDSHWMGAWDLSLFANQLSDERYIKDSNFAGARLTFKPLRQLEVGFNTTQLWGGEMESNKGKQEPFNRTSGFDWRLGHAFSHMQTALYHQLVQRNAGDFATGNKEKAQLIGLEMGTVLFGLNSRLALEQQDTRNGEQSIFDHGFYRTGYRNYGRTMASSIGTASNSTTLIGDHYLSNGHQFSWKLGSADLNKDNIEAITDPVATRGPASSPSSPALQPTNEGPWLQSPENIGGHMYGPQHIALQFADLSYKLPLSDWVQLELGAQYLSESLNFAGETLSSSGYLQVNIEL